MKYLVFFPYSFCVCVCVSWSECDCAYLCITERETVIWGKQYFNSGLKKLCFLHLKYYALNINNFYCYR